MRIPCRGVTCFACSLVALTVHFIQRMKSDTGLVQLQLRNIVIHVGDPKLRSKTAPALKEYYSRVFKMWNIDKRIFSATTDQGSNYVKAIKLFGFNHIPCAAHMLDKVLVAAQASFAEPIARLKHMTNKLSYVTSLSAE
jgi:hypothetical protein